MRAPARAAPFGAAALVLALIHVTLGWPGVVPYDGVTQYAQALRGQFDDWHPPIMARLWQALLPLGGGAAPMFVLQVAAYWLGLGLIATALGASGRHRTATATLALGALPLFAGWIGVVVKDAQMAAALVAATGIIAAARLGERRLSVSGTAAAALLIGYATLVRANALFATVPLVALLWPASWRARLVAAAGALAALLLVGPVINHQLLGAAPTPVARSLLVYDLAGIAEQAPAILTPAERALIEGRHCYRPYFWDPLGDPARCGAFAEQLEREAPAALAARWLGAIAAHPIAYGAHRLAHWNMTERQIVGRQLLGAAPPDASEPNRFALGTPRAAQGVAAAAARQAETPLGWPALWLGLAVLVLIVGLPRPRAPARDLALALAGSAVAIEASFIVVSIAADLRYHLWSMLAAGLAALLVLDERPRRLPWRAGAVLLGILVAGAAARTILPPAPATYQAMLRG